MSLASFMLYKAYPLCILYNSTGFLFNFKNIGPSYSSGSTRMATKQVISKVFIYFMLRFAVMSLG